MFLVDCVFLFVWKLRLCRLVVEFLSGEVLLSRLAPVRAGVVLSSL